MQPNGHDGNETDRARLISSIIVIALEAAEKPGSERSAAKLLRIVGYEWGSSLGEQESVMNEEMWTVFRLFEKTDLK